MTTDRWSTCPMVFHKSTFISANEPGFAQQERELDGAVQCGLFFCKFINQDRPLFVGNKTRFFFSNFNKLVFLLKNLVFALQFALFQNQNIIRATHQNIFTFCFYMLAITVSADSIDFQRAFTVRKVYFRLNYVKLIPKLVWIYWTYEVVLLFLLSILQFLLVSNCSDFRAYSVMNLMRTLSLG